MLPDKVKRFIKQNHYGVVSTFRKDGAVQMSLVSCGPFKEGVAFTTTAGRAKLANLKRNPKCSILVSQQDWWGYVVLEGQAKIMDRDNTDHEELRLALRDVYRAASGQEHPDWNDYDKAMTKDKRAVVIVEPQRIYGTKA
ncbi:MAG: PPOX class F420-dependent oxidoreductase [SAR202 cluster bacterium]|nr:PPOX class F420-dependent oxidoreductase [SAR202 cluster bacterium]